MTIIGYTMTGSDYYIEKGFSFHQKYPEFNTEDKVKEIYEISVKALSNLHQISNDALQNITLNKESLE